jgi:hypothetical protein
MRVHYLSPIKNENAPWLDRARDFSRISTNELMKTEIVVYDQSLGERPAGVGKVALAEPKRLCAKAVKKSQISRRTNY